MGSYAYLEVDQGKTIRITDEKGVNLGKGLDAFISICSSINALGEDSPEIRWFKKLENESRRDIQVITRIIYSGEWDYTTKDYDKFRNDFAGYLSLTEEEFTRNIKRIEEK